MILGSNWIWSWVLQHCWELKLTKGAFPLHGTARYGSVRFTFGGFSTGYCTWTWYFFSTHLGRGFQAIRTITKTWRVNSADHWLAEENPSLLHHWTCDTRPNIDPLDLNQHRQQRIERTFCLNKSTFLNQPKNVCFVVCWGSSDVPLVDSRGADPARAEWKSLMYILFALCIFLEYVFCLYFTLYVGFCFN